MSSFQEKPALGSAPATTNQSAVVRRSADLAAERSSAAKQIQRSLKAWRAEEPEGAEPEGAEPEGAEPEGAEPGGADVAEAVEGEEEPQSEGATKLQRKSAEGGSVKASTVRDQLRRKVHRAPNDESSEVARKVYRKAKLGPAEIAKLQLTFNNWMDEYMYGKVMATRIRMISANPKPSAEDQKALANARKGLTQWEKEKDSILGKAVDAEMKLEAAGVKAKRHGKLPSIPYP